MTMVEPLVQLAGIAKTLGGRAIVRDLSVTIEAGEIVGLVGANGGGKTTTLRMLAGLLRPDAGSGRVLGRDIFRLGAVGIGYMPQQLALHGELTVAENLALRRRIFGLPRFRVEEVVEAYKLSAVFGTRVERLSGGWARRAQFAATVLPAPELLLLDEPTAGLDVVARSDLWQWMADLAGRGAGVVISTHDLAEAERCPTILHYAEGRIEGPISPADLVERAGAGSLKAAVAALAR